MAKRTFGAKLKVGGKLVGKLTDLKPPGNDVAMIDVTSHDSADNTKEFMGGLVDPGELTVTGICDDADEGQTYLYANPGKTDTFEITLTGGTKFAGTCVIGKFEPGDNPLDKEQTFSGSLKISGKVTKTAGA